MKKDRIRTSEGRKFMQNEMNKEKENNGVRTRRKRTRRWRRSKY